MRKIIYIGEYNGEIIYFDSKNNTILKANKSKYLNTDKTKYSAKYIYLILIFLIISGSGIGFFIGTNQTFHVYTVQTLVLLAIVWTVEFLLLTTFIHRVLYKNVKECQSATRKEFRQAVQGNNIWNMFSDKKVTIGKKVIAWTMTLVVLLCSISFFYILYMINKEGNLLGTKIGSEIIALSFLGFLPSISFIMIWEN
ncbi:hypothetical protein PIG00_002505, partial [Enterococcus faecalis]|nr:hypothetical protein [Enterococcus faecalis]